MSARNASSTRSATALEHKFESIQSGNDALMRAEDFYRKLGIGDWHARQLRRAGLRVFYSGAKAFIFASDAMDAFRRIRDAQHPSVAAEVDDIVDSSSSLRRGSC